MIRKSLVVLAIALLFSSAALTAQVRTTKPNDVTFELGGKCLIFSLGYQRTLVSNFGLEAGLSYIGGGGGGDNVGVFFLTGGGRFYFIKKDASPYISGGLAWVSAGTDAGPFGEDSESGVYFYASPGFEYRMAGGFLFRAGAYILIRSGSFFVWPGISLGISF
jgi:hypothetical protein